MTSSRGAVVVGIDGSNESVRAARWAAREAEVTDAPLLLLNVGHLPVPAHSPIALPGGLKEALIDLGNESLRHASHAALQEAPHVAISQSVLVGGGVTAELVAASRDARMIVLGNRGLGAFLGLLIGSVAAAVAANAGCPVVVVRGECLDGLTPDDRPVVVGVDGSRDSDRALEFAFRFAAARKVPLVAVRVWNESTIDTPWPDWPVILGEDEVAETELASLADQVAPVGEDYPSVEVHLRSLRGRPARTLLSTAAAQLPDDAASGAQLVVVGSRGRGALAGLALGSVSQAVLHRASCPVAIVRNEP